VNPMSSFVPTDVAKTRMREDINRRVYINLSACFPRAALLRGRVRQSSRAREPTHV
jgi:hypothetical protein